MPEMQETATLYIEKHAKNLSNVIEFIFPDDQVKEYTAAIERAVKICLDGDFHQADMILHEIGKLVNERVKTRR